MFLGKGVFYIDGIFDFGNVSSGKINYQSGIMMGEAMKYAVGSVNNTLEELFRYSLEIKKIYGSNNEDDLLNNVLQTFFDKSTFLDWPLFSRNFL